MAFGSPYITLDKLKRKVLDIYSKAIKYYRLGEEGITALAETKKIHDVMCAAVQNKECRFKKGVKFDEEINVYHFYSYA